MAGDWIKMETELSEKPEVIKISGILKESRYTIVGRLHKLWSWFDKHSIDGHADGVTEMFLDELVNRDGFSVALREVDWLQVRSGSLVVPRFSRHNGQSAKKRAQATDRKRKSRETSPIEGDKCHADGVTKARPEKRRVEKSIESDKSDSFGPDKPPPREKASRFQRKAESVDEIADYLKKHGLPKSDAEWLWLKWEANGWKRSIGSKEVPIERWKHTASQWFKMGLFPSQKNGAAKGSSYGKEGQF